MVAERSPPECPASAYASFRDFGKQSRKYLSATLLENLKPIACKDATSLLKNFVKNQEIHFRRCTARFKYLSVSEFLNRAVYIISKMNFLDFIKIFYRYKRFTRYQLLRTCHPGNNIFAMTVSTNPSKGSQKSLRRYPPADVVPCQMKHLFTLFRQNHRYNSAKDTSYRINNPCYFKSIKHKSPYQKNNGCK